MNQKCKCGKFMKLKDFKRDSIGKIYLYKCSCGEEKNARGNKVNQFSKIGKRES